MKKVVILLLCSFLFSFPCFAEETPCDDVIEATKEAASNRNSQVQEVLDVGMPNPGDYRWEIAGCLDVIAKTGDIFSMGVTIPSMDDIITGLCKEASRQINDVVNDTLGNVKRETWQLKRYTINTNPKDLANASLKNLD